jgi:hypothetical protein
MTGQKSASKDPEAVTSAASGGRPVGKFYPEPPTSCVGDECSQMLSLIAFRHEIGADDETASTRGPGGYCSFLMYSGDRCRPQGPGVHRPGLSPSHEAGRATMFAPRGWEEDLPYDPVSMAPCDRAKCMKLTFTCLRPFKGPGPAPVPFACAVRRRGWHRPSPRPK